MTRDFFQRPSLYKSGIFQEVLVIKRYYQHDKFILLLCYNSSVDSYRHYVNLVNVYNFNFSDFGAQTLVFNRVSNSTPIQTE